MLLIFVGLKNVLLAERHDHWQRKGNERTRSFASYKWKGNKDVKLSIPDGPRLSSRCWRTILALFAAVSLVAGSFGLANFFGTAATPALAAGSLPCDVYAAAGTPCVAAHSIIRALFAAYNGPLYQIQRASDKQYLDIGLLSAGGYANAAPQVSFCAGTTCTITKLYDQTANHNDMPISWGGYWKGPGPNGADVGADAMALPVTVAGHQVYGVKVTPGVGYRIDNAKGAPTGSQPEGIYMVTSSNYVNSQCCFDYGSGETSHTDTGNATMNALYWGTACWFGTRANNPCVGTGPWVEADLENGMYHTNTGSNKDPNNSGVHFSFVSAFEKNNGTSNFTLKYGNSQSGGLTTPYSGPLPNGYSPMKLQNSLLLGTGGDNSVGGEGEFFEGAITAGYPTDAAENAVQTSIVAAGYGSSTPPTPTPTPNSTGYAINAGGTAAGSFLADAYYSGGSTYSTTTSIDSSGVSNPAPQAVYQAERYGNFTYTLPGFKPGASYTVRLHEDEIYWTSSGQRLFNVSINGQQVLTNFDIYATAGAANKAVVEAFTTTADANGQITIQFTSVKDNAKVNGIEVLANSSSTPTPISSPTSTPTHTPTPSPTTGSTPTSTPTSGTGGSACSVQYAITNQWQGGFGASVTITNTGNTTINGWTLAWTFANGQTVTQIWNATETQTGGSVSATNVSYNGTVAPGGTATFGFNGSWNGSNAIPTSFVLNGQTC